MRTTLFIIMIILFLIPVLLIAQESSYITEWGEISEDEQLESLLETIRSLVDNTYMDIKKSLKLMYMERAVEKKGGPKARKLSSIHFTNSELHLTVEQAESLIDEIRSLMKTYDVLTKRNIENQVETLVFGLSVIMGPHYHKTPRKDFKELDTDE